MDANKTGPGLGRQAAAPGATRVTNEERTTSSKPQRRDRSGSHRAGFDEQGTADTSESDMDSAGDAYRRKTGQSMPNGGKKSRGSLRKHKASHEEYGKANQKSVDHHESDFSSLSTDDVEMDHLGSEDGLSDDEETGLTKKDRKNRRTRRRRTTTLDARIGGGAMTSEQERKIADKAVFTTMLINIALIASWYLFSLSISIYNKWMFTPKYLDFHFPLFTTCLHMLVQFGLAASVLYFVPSLRPRFDSISNPHNHESIRKEAPQGDKPLMTRMFYLTRCVPCGAATGLDIGLGNMSLKLITLTFYTMCKSSSLAFVLCFAFLFRLEKPSVKLILIIATMTLGVIMMVAGETVFDALGFILVMSAAFFSGFRWSLTQILLLRSPATSNPFSSIFYLAPVMFLSLAIIAIPVEGFVELGQGLAKLTEANGLFMGICILLFPGLLAFMMTASEFALLQRTSVVTLSICGIFKEVVTISAAGIVFHDPLTPINVTGLLVTIASIAAYNYLKITKMREEAKNDAEEKQRDADIGSESEDDDEDEESMASAKQREGRNSLTVPTEGRTRAASKASAKSSRENE